MQYVREDGCRAWLTCGQLSPETMRGLLAEHGSAEALYDRVCHDRGDCLHGLVSEKQLTRLLATSARAQMHEMMAVMAANEIGILGEDEVAYPDALRSLNDAPPLLFYQGDPLCLNRPRCITMIGTRRPTTEGDLATGRIARELAEHQVSVVSGLAMGIDSAAHRGCIEGQAPTVAVVACGLDVTYPVENTALRRKLLDSGGVILSEYPPGTRVFRGHFTVRNRILSGLSRATVLMEAKIQSGSMTTVHHALAQGREVFAYPGIPNTKGAEAAHQLLREGARYFTTAADILEDLDWLEEEVPTAEESRVLPTLLPDQTRILTLLRRGSLSHDAIAMETGMDPAELGTALTLLQLMGFVKALPGKVYCLA